MNLGIIVGQVVATRKDDRLVGGKLLIVHPYNDDILGLSSANNTYVAIDTVGAGVGEIVLVCRGYAATKALKGFIAPVDAAIVGIVDTIDRYDIGHANGGGQK